MTQDASRTGQPRARPAADDADVIVVGNTLDEYRQLEPTRHNGQIIIDLARMFERRTSEDGRYQGICW